MIKIEDVNIPMTKADVPSIISCWLRMISPIIDETNPKERSKTVKVKTKRKYDLFLYSKGIKIGVK
jgi:hypothetical protein